MVSLTAPRPGKAKKKRKLSLTVGYDPITVKAVFKRAHRR
jgi:hypothetical protein